MEVEGVVDPPVLNGIVRLDIPWLACWSDLRWETVGLTVVGSVPGWITGAGGGGGGSGGFGILGARHMIKDCVLI